MIERWHDRLDASTCRGCGHCVPECRAGDVAFAQPPAVARACPNYLHLLATRKKRTDGFPPANDMPDDRHADIPDCPEDDMLKHFVLAACEKRFTASNWPVKFALTPVDAEFFRNSDMIIVADCATLIVEDIYSRYIGDSPVVMLCPRMQDVKSVTDKLHGILDVSHPKSLTILRMEVPCCNALNAVASQALESSGAGIAFIDIVVSLDGSEH